MEDLAVLDEQHTLRRAGRLHTVRYHNNRLALLVDLPEQFHEAIRCMGIERAGRLIRKNQLRIGNQRTRNGCTLLLSAGHLIWVFIEDLGDAEFFRNRLCPKTHLLVFFSFQHERQINVVTQGKGIEQVEVLEHET